MGLEVDADDIEELLEDYSIELTTEVLEHLQNEPEKKLADKIEESEEDDDVSTSQKLLRKLSYHTSLTTSHNIIHNTASKPNTPPQLPFTTSTTLSHLASTKGYHQHVPLLWH